MRRVCVKTIFSTMLLTLLVVNAGEKSKLIQEADNKMDSKDYTEAFVLYKKSLFGRKKWSWVWYGWNDAI